MSYSIDAITEDCYEGTSCLINKLGIKDDKKLKEFEAVALRLYMKSAFVDWCRE